MSEKHPNFEIEPVNTIRPQEIKYMQMPQALVQTAFRHKLLFAGFLVPLCPKRALVWGTVVRGFARRDLC